MNNYSERQERIIAIVKLWRGGTAIIVTFPDDDHEMEVLAKGVWKNTTLLKKLNQFSKQLNIGFYDDYKEEYR